MNTYPVIILAGGKGTRLSSVVSDVPKPIALVNGKPFLHYIFSYLQKQQIKQVILSVGYLSDVIIQYFGSEYLGIKIKYVIEKEALGTGGAIKYAFEQIDEAAYVINGDTFFNIDLKQLADKHADAVIALKPMEKFDRYGTVELDNDSRIIHFLEKQYCEEGLINGGIYFIQKSVFDKIQTPDSFSMEKNIFEKHADDLKIQGKIFTDYFIDIGIPEDYYLAQHYFSSLL